MAYKRCSSCGQVYDLNADYDHECPSEYIKPELINGWGNAEDTKPDHPGETVYTLPAGMTVGPIETAADIAGLADAMDAEERWYALNDGWVT